MSKIIAIDTCHHCPLADMEQYRLKPEPKCIHPATRIFSQEYEERHIPKRGIRKDCPLSDSTVINVTKIYDAYNQKLHKIMKKNSK